MQKGERDYLAPVRKRWISDGWISESVNGITTTANNLGKLSKKIGQYKANKCWDRVAYLAKIAAGIQPGRSPQFTTDDQREEAKKVAERLLEVVYGVSERDCE